VNKYILYKIYQKRVENNWPEIIKMYLMDVPPVVELTRNKADAYTFDDISEAKEMAYLLNMSVREV